MIKWVAIPLLIVLGLQTASLPFLALRLEMERETVAIPMCVNKERTDIMCLGSCYINLHLEAALEQSTQQPGETLPPAAPITTLSPLWINLATDWTLQTPSTAAPTLRPNLPNWEGGDYRLPHQEPPRA